MVRRSIVIGVLIGLVAAGAVSTAVAGPPGPNDPLHGYIGPAPPPPPPPPSPPAPTPSVEYVIFFNAGQATVTPRARAVLKKVSEAVAGNAASLADYSKQLAQYNTMLGNDPKSPNYYNGGDIVSREQPQITVVGYTSPRGSTARDLQLSRLRAKAAAAALVKLGVPAKAIATSGKGKADPVVPGANPQNERVVIDTSYMRN